MRKSLALAALMPWVVFAFDAAAEPSLYSKAVQQACAADYKKYCGEYGIETAALRTCMDKNGHSLTIHAFGRLLMPAKSVGRRSIGAKNRDVMTIIE